MMADRQSRVTELLGKLVAFDTVSDKSNLPLIDFIAEYLSGLGVSSLKAPNASGDKAALFATNGPARDGGVLLSGHTDVVPVEGQSWTSDPFQLREANGRLHARGACDMKGFDAVVLAMIPEFLAAPLARPIHLLFSYDEETTCRGSLDFIARLGVDLPKPSMVVVGEPTLMAVADAHQGVATFKTIVTGVEAHSANPRIGANAISAACEIVAEIDRLGRSFEAPEWLDPRFDPPYSTFHVGMIHGGVARNILARECMFHWEFRGLPNLTSEAAFGMVRRFIDERALPRLRRFTAEPTIETIMEVDVPGLAADSRSPASTLGLALARSNATIAVSYATEAGHFQRAAMPTIVCGPGSIEQAHKADEFVDIAQLLACARFLEDLAIQLHQ